MWYICDILSADSDLRDKKQRCLAMDNYCHFLQIYKWKVKMLVKVKSKYVEVIPIT